MCFENTIKIYIYVKQEPQQNRRRCNLLAACGLCTMHVTVPFWAGRTTVPEPRPHPWAAEFGVYAWAAIFPASDTTADA